MMHREVLDLVPELEQKNEKYNARRYKEFLQEHDRMVIETYSREVESLLIEQNEIYEEELKEKDEETKTSVNEFLSEEAEGVRRKRWLRKNSACYRRIEFEGQKRLLAALHRAKQDFNTEKLEALAETIAALNIIAAARKFKSLEEHQKQVDDLNSHWLGEFKTVQAKWRKEREEKLKEVEIESISITEHLNEKLENVLRKKSEELQLKKEFIERKVNDEIENNTIARETIEGLETKSNNISLYTCTVMKSFCQFVCSTSNIGEEDAMEFIEMFKQSVAP